MATKYLLTITKGKGFPTTSWYHIKCWMYTLFAFISATLSWLSLQGLLNSATSFKTNFYFPRPRTKLSIDLDNYCLLQETSHPLSEQPRLQQPTWRDGLHVTHANFFIWGQTSSFHKLVLWRNIATPCRDHKVSQDFFSPPISYQVTLWSDWKVSCFQAWKSQNPPHLTSHLLPSPREAEKLMLKIAFPDSILTKSKDYF